MKIHFEKVDEFEFPVLKNTVRLKVGDALVMKKHFAAQPAKVDALEVLKDDDKNEAGADGPPQKRLRGKSSSRNVTG